MNDHDHAHADIEDVRLALLLSLDWLTDMSDLVAISLTNRILLIEVLEARHLWDPFRCSVCNLAHENPFLICKVCQKRYCNDCQGRMVVPFHCNGCFTLVYVTAV
jgi:hypothetical protein